MTQSCEHCGSARLVRKGRSQRTFERLRDGVIVPYDGAVTRVLCRGCGRNGTLYDQGDLAADREVRDHVVGRVFALGRNAAAIETGVPRTTVQRHVEAWCTAREADVLDVAPDFLLLEPVRIRGEDCILAIDVDREALVEILPAGEALQAWIGAPGRLPALRVCARFDPATISMVRTMLPATKVMVAPVMAARALRMEADLCLRALRRRPAAKGCNAMPTPNEFSRSLASDAGVEPGWPTAVTALRAAVRAVLELLAARSRSEGERRLPEAELAASSCERILRWLRVWREPILEGLDHAFVDRTAMLAAGVRRAIVRRRPALGLSDNRALALLRDFVRRSIKTPPGMPRRTVSMGRPLNGLEALLGA
ncbi:MAG: hypothetical protein K2X54_28585 [Methylobacterium organophilum]|nr:hypothetical protein [Methylobacterium organophilum]